MHVLAAGRCTQVEKLGFFCVSDSCVFFFKGVAVAQSVGRALEKEPPGTL